jgi:hypothetical protein
VAASAAVGVAKAVAAASARVAAATLEAAALPVDGDQHVPTSTHPETPLAR